MTPRVIILILASSLLTFASSPREQIDEFVKSLKTGNAEKSITQLFSSNTLFGGNKQQITMMSAQLETALKLYGVAESSDEVSREEITSRVLRISEITNHKNHPLSWEFYFYKIEDKWVISQAVFGDQFQYAGNRK